MGIDKWHQEAMPGRRDKYLQDTVDRLGAKLYGPSGLHLSYRRDIAVHFNAVIDGDLNVLHRTAYRRLYADGVDRYECATSKGLNGVATPFDNADDVDLLIVGIRNFEGEVTGCFILPKSELVQRRYFSARGTDGLMTISLYPPWTDLASVDAGKRWRMVAETQTWQADFFVDLSKGHALVEERQKFLRLVQRARNDKASVAQ